jgi:FdrA protein
LISKPAAPEVAERVLRAAADVGKPIVACVLGAALSAPAGVRVASNLYQAARLAAAPSATWHGMEPGPTPRPRFKTGQRTVRGLFCGGTLAEEAELALAAASVEREIIDFGDDRYTRGRAHPMLDPSLRNQAILDAASDPSVAVLLLDVILGFGAHADPAGAAAPVLRESQARAAAEGRQLTVLAHVVGTELDPQSLARQEETLRASGVHVFSSNHHAAIAAALVLDGART